MPIELYVDRVVNHMRVNFSMIRIVASEDEDSVSPDLTARRKYAKSGAFRKKLTASDWVVLKSLLALYKKPSAPPKLDVGKPTLSDIVERPLAHHAETVFACRVLRFHGFSCLG